MDIYILGVKKKKSKVFLLNFIYYIWYDCNYYFIIITNIYLLLRTYIIISIRILEIQNAVVY